MLSNEDKEMEIDRYECEGAVILICYQATKVMTAVWYNGKLYNEVLVFMPSTHIPNTLLGATTTSWLRPISYTEPDQIDRDLRTAIIKNIVERVSYKLREKRVGVYYGRLVGVPNNVTSEVVIAKPTSLGIVYRILKVS